MRGWPVALALMLAVVVVIGGLACLSRSMQHAPVLGQQIGPGDAVIYSERLDDYHANRIMRTDNCYIVQEWDPWSNEWRLKLSSPGALGGTAGIPTVQCTLTPIMPGGGE